MVGNIIATIMMIHMTRKAGAGRPMVGEVIAMPVAVSMPSPARVSSQTQHTAATANSSAMTRFRWVDCDANTMT